MPSKFTHKIFILSIFLLAFPMISLSGNHEIANDQTTSDEALEEKMLLFEDNFPRNQSINIKIDESRRIKPHQNDFNLVHFAPMSNKLGERWALVTVENSSAGQRILKDERLVATFANGDQSRALDLHEELKPGENLSKTIFFGTNKFPIISIQVEP